MGCLGFFNLGGSCGCGVEGLFDTYGIVRDSNTHPLGLVRMPSLVATASIIAATPPNEAATAYDSKDAFGWVCPIASMPSGDCYTFTSVAGGSHATDSEIVWTIQFRDSSYFAAAYDAAAKTELFASDLTAAGMTIGTAAAYAHLNVQQINGSYWPIAITGPSASFSICGVADDHFFAWVRASPGDEPWGNWLKVELDGTMTFIPTQTGFGGIINGGVSRTWSESGDSVQVQFAAPRFAPLVAARKANTLLYGDVSLVSTGGGNYRMEISDRTTVWSTGTSPVWRFFDYGPNGWAGVFEYTLSGTVHTVLMIDGSVIYDYPRANIYQPSFGSNFVGAGSDRVFMRPHVCHPSEGSAGAPVIAFGMIDYSVAPTVGSPNGTVADEDRPYVLVLYQNGSEIWRSPRNRYPMWAQSSSDRWIYCTGWHQNDEPTETVWTTAVNEDIEVGHNYWLVNHDGTQVTATGQFEESGGSIGGELDRWPGVSFPSSQPVNVPHLLADRFIGSTGSSHIRIWPHDVVHNTALVERPLPADASSFADEAILNPQ